MPRALITGIGGFVGPYLKDELERSWYDVYGVERSRTIGERMFTADVTDVSSLESVLAAVRPDVIFHLAGLSSVSESWHDTKEVERVNVGGTKSLFNSIKKLGVRPTVLMVSSAEVYGIPKRLPIRETDRCAPVTPYGRSRLKQEELVTAAPCPVVISRSFNHTGPGQSPLFVVPGFAVQAVRVRHGLESYVNVGNLEAVRDFTDVRDVVRAYRLLVEKGVSHERYNVCSGQGVRVADILKTILDAEGLNEGVVRLDKDRQRLSDIPALVGDSTKITTELGWRAEIPFLDRTVKDILHYWEEHVETSNV